MVGPFGMLRLGSPHTQSLETERRSCRLLRRKGKQPSASLLFAAHRPDVAQDRPPEGPTGPRNVGLVLGCHPGSAHREHRWMGLSPSGIVDFGAMPCSILCRYLGRAPPAADPAPPPQTICPGRKPMLARSANSFSIRYPSASETCVRS